MYVNKCIKCGREFETKNPKRVICPDCLYPDKKMMVSGTSGDEQSASLHPQDDTAGEKPKFYNSYSSGGDDNTTLYRPQQPRQNRLQGSYNRQGSYGSNRQNYNRQGGYNRPQGGYNRQGNYNGRPGGFQQRRPQGLNKFNKRNKNKAPRQLLVSKEQLEQIELLYKLMLPLPNPDAHEVIGEKIGLEPRKVFFGINLVRQKMMLPKLPFPKRKLAITPDQMNAIKMLYEPLLPLPPIGCHKIIASQLKMDEWRVHVGIGLVRAQMGMERWNPDRPDAPEEFKNQSTDENKTEELVADSADEPKKKRGRKPKKEPEIAPEE